MSIQSLCLVHTPLTLSVWGPELYETFTLPLPILHSGEMPKQTHHELMLLINHLKLRTIDLALSPSLLPVHCQPLQQILSRQERWRYLHHQHIRGTYAEGYCIRMPDQEPALVSCRLSHALILLLSAFWRQRHIKVRRIYSLGFLLEEMLKPMAFTHIFILKEAWESALGLVTQGQLTYFDDPKNEPDKLAWYLTHSLSQERLAQSISLMHATPPLPPGLEALSRARLPDDALFTKLNPLRQQLNAWLCGWYIFPTTGP